jgi:RecA/RadA recombinase
MSKPNELLDKFLKENKEDHYNFEEAFDYRISSGSLLLDMNLGGGFAPGLHRFTGMNEGGKTSEALEVMRNFCSSSAQRRGLYIKAEGRLPKEMTERSGVKFVYTADEWVDGTCFVFESNIYETVMTLMRNLVGSKDGIQYCFIVDSVDGLIAKNDLNKSLEESVKVAGGAVIASTMMKKISIALAKRGHMAIFVSQVRADIKLDPYSKAPIRQISSTGGNALLHFANWILEFEPRFQKDLILKNPNAKFGPDNPPIGHTAKVTVKKSPNEKTNTVIAYPILYNQKGGKSIWRSKEVLDMLLAFEMVEKKGAWYNFSDESKEMMGLGEDVNLKFQGEDKAFKFLEEHPDYVNVFYKYFVEMLSE